MPITREDVAKLRENDPRTPLSPKPSLEADKQRPEWLEGAPMDPCASPAEPLPCVPGFPFTYAGACAVIVGPTGSGRSSLIQAGKYDAARAGKSCAYLGCEVGTAEFNARAAVLAEIRGDAVDDKLRAELARVRYLDLIEVITAAWATPEDWVSGIVGAYEIVAIDPVSAVASALSLDFDKSNDDWVRFYDRLIMPLTSAGVLVLLLDNVGHAEDAKRRAKGASAKSDRADLTFSCSLCAEPVGLLIKAHKVRGVRAGFRRGDEWLFAKDSQRITRREGMDRPAFRPTHIMQRVSETVEQSPGLSRNAIRTAVGGRAENVTLAVELLLSEGYVKVRRDGKAHAHYSVTPFREPTGSTESQPSPNQVPDSVEEPGPPSPGPLRPDSVPDPVQPHTPESLIAAVNAGTITEADADRAWQQFEVAS